MKYRTFAAALLIAACAFGHVAYAEIKEPPMMPRTGPAGWKAKPDVKANMIPQGPAYKGIVVHHTATLQSAWKSKTTEQKIATLQAGHLKHPFIAQMKMPGKLWGDFAYHYYIDTNGKIAVGRDPQYQGDSNTRYDLSGRLLVVLEGNFEQDVPTKEQLKSLDEIVAWLAAKHGLSAEQITGHKDLAKNQTPCPGKNLESYLPELK